MEEEEDAVCLRGSSTYITLLVKVTPEDAVRETKDACEAETLAPKVATNEKVDSEHGNETEELGASPVP